MMKKINEYLESSFQGALCHQANTIDILQKYVMFSIKASIYSFALTNKYFE